MLINQMNKFVIDLGLVLGLKGQWDLNVKPNNSSCMTTRKHKGLENPMNLENTKDLKAQ